MATTRATRYSPCSALFFCSRCRCASAACCARDAKPRHCCACRAGWPRSSGPGCESRHRPADCAAPACQSDGTGLSGCDCAPAAGGSPPVYALTAEPPGVSRDVEAAVGTNPAHAAPSPAADGRACTWHAQRLSVCMAVSSDVLAVVCPARGKLALTGLALHASAAGRKACTAALTVPGHRRADLMLCLRQIPPNMPLKR